MLTAAGRIVVLGCTVITPLMSQDAKTGPAFWRSYYAFCDAIRTSSPAATHSADRLSSFMLLLNSIRIQGSARRSRPTGRWPSDVTASGVLQASSRLSCHCKCSRATAWWAFCSFRDMFGLQHPFAVPGRPFQEIRDTETSRAW